MSVAQWTSGVPRLSIPRFGTHLELQFVKFVLVDQDVGEDLSGVQEQGDVSHSINEQKTAMDKNYYEN